MFLFDYFTECIHILVTVESRFSSNNYIYDINMTWSYHITWYNSYLTHWSRKHSKLSHPNKQADNSLIFSLLKIFTPSFLRRKFWTNTKPNHTYDRVFKISNHKGFYSKPVCLCLMLFMSCVSKSVKNESLYFIHIVARSLYYYT